MQKNIVAYIMAGKLKDQTNVEMGKPQECKSFAVFGQKTYIHRRVTFKWSLSYTS
jgi:hypothetical protein